MSFRISILASLVYLFNGCDSKINHATNNNWAMQENEKASCVEQQRQVIKKFANTDYDLTELIDFLVDSKETQNELPLCTQ